VDTQIHFTTGGGPKPPARAGWGIRLRERFTAPWKWDRPAADGLFTSAMLAAAIVAEMSVHLTQPTSDSVREYAIWLDAHLAQDEQRLRRAAPQPRECIEIRLRKIVPVDPILGSLYPDLLRAREHALARCNRSNSAAVPICGGGRPHRMRCCG
jgi:hypothetical protein